MEGLVTFRREIHVTFNWYLRGSRWLVWDSWISSTERYQMNKSLAFHIADVKREQSKLSLIKNQYFLLHTVRVFDYAQKIVREYASVWTRLLGRVVCFA